MVVVPVTYRVSPCFETAGSILSDSSTMSPQFIDSDARTDEINTDEINSSRTIGILGKRIGLFGESEGVILRAISEAVLTFAVDFW